MKYLDLFLKQYRISLSHQKGIEVSGIILFLKLMTLRIYWVFRASSKPVRNFYAVSYLPASENLFKALTNSGF